LLREAQMQVRQRFSLLESGAEARLSVRALLCGGAEEFMRRMCAEENRVAPEASDRQDSG
jgi:hypothetical protein